MLSEGSNIPFIKQHINSLVTIDIGIHKSVHGNHRTEEGWFVLDGWCSISTEWFEIIWEKKNVKQMVQEMFKEGKGGKAMVLGMLHNVMALCMGIS